VLLMMTATADLGCKRTRPRVLVGFAPPRALGRDLGVLTIMTRRTFQTAIVLLPLSFALAGCARFSAPYVELRATNTIKIRYSDSYGLARFRDHPIIEASINGVIGPFVIDTGATIPILNMTAVRRCGISVSAGPVKTGDFWGDQVGMKLATNVSLQLAPGLVVHWPKVLVHPGEDVTFGTLDYGTLRAGHAVIDTNQKTITMTR